MAFIGGFKTLLGREVIFPDESINGDILPISLIEFGRNFLLNSLLILLIKGCFFFLV